MSDSIADADMKAARELLDAALGYWAAHEVWPAGDPDGERELRKYRAELIPACRRMLDLIGDTP